MQRLTVEKAREVFEQTGLEPIRGAFMGYTGGTPTSACLIGALHYSRFGEQFGDGYVRDLADDHKTEDYYWGIVLGWDGMEVIPQSSVVVLGVEDGKAIAKAIFGEE